MTIAENSPAYNQDLSNFSEAMKFSCLLTEEEQNQVLSKLTEEQLQAFPYDWNWWGRPKQLIPTTTFMKGPWSYALALAGRGFGKTRMGAEWVRHLAESGQYKRGTIVAPTAADARDTLVEGESGILSVCPPWNMPLYEPAKRRLTWPNGTRVTIYSADEPRRLRGQNSAFAWCDELAAWERAEDAWRMLVLGLRIGKNPKALITTTPLPIKVLFEIAEDPNTLLIEGTTYENRVNLADLFFKSIARFEGTSFGDQELHGKLQKDIGVLFKPTYISRCNKDETPTMTRVVVAIDPATTKKATSDETGIAVCGLGTDNKYYLLHVEGEIRSPKEWSDRVAELYNQFSADCIVAEKNNGGEMVEFTIQQGYKNLPVKLVDATRGKVKRAEPISLLYQEGRVVHVRPIPYHADTTFAPTPSDFQKYLSDQLSQTERQLYSFKGGDNEANDKADALVWGMTELSINEFKAYEVPSATAYNSPRRMLQLI